MAPPICSPHFKYRQPITNTSIFKIQHISVINRFIDDLSPLTVYDKCIEASEPFSTDLLSVPRGINLTRISGNICNADWTCLTNFTQPIVRNNAELGFEILKTRVNDARRRHIAKVDPLSTMHRGSKMMSNRLLEDGREPMRQTMKKLSRNSLHLGDRLKNCKTGKTQ